MKFGKSFKESVQAFAIKQAMNYLEGNPEENIPKLMTWVDRLSPEDYYPKARANIRKAIDEKNNWYQLILRLYQLDPGVRKTAFQNFLINATLSGSVTQRETAQREGCNVPWAMLVDPTSACNLHCTGCWAAEYGNRLNLSLEDLDSIVSQGKALGTYMYLFTGGEPLVRKKDIIKLCEMHPDCEFLSFTNGTLIDEEFCQEMLRVKNFVPAFSLEGFEEANDARRGQGVYQKVRHAMDLLKAHKLPFGLSICYTSANYDVVTGEAFIDSIIDSGALFAWFFHYMPVGAGAVPALLPDPEQRTVVRQRIRDYRETKPLFTIDFQNDGPYVGGCIAGGRCYLHINAKGDVEPCAFVHYSDSNIHEVSLLQALKNPLFMAYHDNQPFNENLLRPCPMLENPEKLRMMVHQSGARSTEYESPENVDDLCDRTTPYAENWAGTADQLWERDFPEKAGK
ncbi:MAG: radical SAM protein [Clostridiales bacterium]|nr:radical SAM protein [Clostridiales bacterium]